MIMKHRKEKGEMELVSHPGFTHMTSSRRMQEQIALKNDSQKTVDRLASWGSVLSMASNGQVLQVRVLVVQLTQNA